MSQPVNIQFSKPRGLIGSAYDDSVTSHPTHPYNLRDLNGRRHNFKLDQSRDSLNESGFIDHDGSFSAPPAPLPNHSAHIRFNDGSSGDCGVFPPPFIPVAAQPHPTYAFPLYPHLSLFPPTQHIYGPSIRAVQDIINQESVKGATSWSSQYSSSDYFMTLLLHERETHKPNILQVQIEITDHDRYKLVDWLIKVCCANWFPGMHKEVLFLCVSLVDTVLTKECVPRTEFQLLGITCLLLSSKKLLYDPPEIKQLLRLCDYVYNTDEMKKYEKHILTVLDWRLEMPTAHTFLDFHIGRLLYKVNFRAEDALEIIRHLAVARYCLMHGFTSLSFSALTPSLRSRCALHVASLMLNTKPILPLLTDNQVTASSELLQLTMMQHAPTQLAVPPSVFSDFCYS